MTKTFFEDAYMEDGKLYFDKRAAADIEVFNTLEDLSDAYHTGETEAEDWLDFTPGFGACTECNHIEDSIIDQSIDDIYLLKQSEVQSDGYSNVNDGRRILILILRSCMN